MNTEKDLKRIITKRKTGEERLSIDGKELNHTMKEFWQWSQSDIVSNATRGVFAEFIVATALGIIGKSVRDEWNAYDLLSPEGIKIEVKSAAYIQSWTQREYSKISFSIKKAKYWDSETNRLGKTMKRHADVYVFTF